MSPELLYFPRLSDTLSAAERTVERTWIAAMPPVPTLPDLAPMLSWARACGMEQCGAAICMVRLTYRHEDRNRWTIHEIFLPVQPENG